MEIEYLKTIQLPEFILDMDLIEFDRWCRTDKYCNTGNDIVDFEVIYSVVSLYPELGKYEDYLFKLIKQ